METLSFSWSLTGWVSSELMRRSPTARAKSFSCRSDSSRDSNAAAMPAIQDGPIRWDTPAVGERPRMDGRVPPGSTDQTVTSHRSGQNCE